LIDSEVGRERVRGKADNFIYQLLTRRRASLFCFEESVSYDRRMTKTHETGNDIIIYADDSFRGCRGDSEGLTG
jgi:hypothetical protein